MLRKTVFFLLILSSALISSNSSLTPQDVKNKSNEILESHVLYKKLTPELSERILKNYISELDPNKVYFIESDIQKWLYPSESMTNKMLEDYERADFAEFEEIHNTMLIAIERRNDLENEVNEQPLPPAIDPKELKDADWAHSKQELIDRIQKIKSLQMESYEKAGFSSKDESSQYLNKKRINRESKIQGKNESDKLDFIHFYILKAVCSSLDAHTTYFTPSEAKQFMIQIQQRLFGIGVILRDNLNGFTIVSIIEKGPADKGKKLKINDKIIAVNQQPVIGMDLPEAVELIMGKKGTKVILTVLREDQNKNNQKIDIEIIRDEIILENTRLQTSIEPYADGVIAHLHLMSFYQDPKSSSFDDMKKAIENIQKEHVLKGVVLDLRNNTGGLLPQAIQVTGLFINKGIVVSIKDNKDQIHHLRNIEENVTWNGPLVVLINRASASASEIVAQTLQDYGRAIIVGDNHSFGKGSFQTSSMANEKINPKGEYKVTRGLYYTVSGKSPQLNGVFSDIVVPSILSELEIGENYEKYPLENDSISENFDDDLSDIPIQHRERLKKFYKHNLQKRITTYTQYIDTLKQNSKIRIDQNKNYQNFLKEIQKKNFEDESIEFFGMSDLQLIETLNIMKDLVYMMEFNQKLAANY